MMLFPFDGLPVFSRTIIKRSLRVLLGVVRIVVSEEAKTTTVMVVVRVRMEDITTNTSKNKPVLKKEGMMSSGEG